MILNYLKVYIEVGEVDGERGRKEAQGLLATTRPTNTTSFTQVLLSYPKSMSLV